MIETFQKYGGSGWILCWFLLAWLYLLRKEEDTNKRIMFVYAPAVVLLLFFNPLFYRTFSGLLEDAIYFRFLWLLPISLVNGYTIIKVYQQLKGKKQICFAVVAMVLVLVSGKLVYTSPLFSKAENMYHVPETVVKICDAIEVEGREVMALFPDEFLYYVRQYTPMVCMPYGREIYLGYYSELHQVLLAEEIDVEKLTTLVKQYGCHYVILHEDKVLSGSLEEYEYILVDVIDGYCIYRDTGIYIGL